MTGTIKYESEALVTCSECGVISSMDTTSYQGNIIAFLGAKDGKLSKVKTNPVIIFKLVKFAAHSALGNMYLVDILRTYT